MKEKIFWIGIAGAVLSWGLNLVYFDSKQLAEPIFMDHYYDGDLSLEGSMVFYYLDNKTEPREVDWVSFDEGLKIWTAGNDEWGISSVIGEEAPVAFDAEYSHYYLKSFRVDWKQASDLFQDENAQNALYEKISVGLNDGTVMEADIGEVRFYHHDYEQEARLWDHMMGSSSNQGEHMDALKVMEDLQIESVSHSLPEKLVKNISIHTGLKYEEITATPDMTKPDEEQFSGFKPWDEVEKPVVMRKNQIFTVEVNLLPEIPVFVQSDILLEGADGEGNPFSKRVTLTHHSSPDENQLADLIDQKKGNGEE